MQSTARRFALAAMLILCSLLLSACYQEIDPWPEVPSATLAPQVTQVPAATQEPTNVPLFTEAPTTPPQVQPGLNG